MKLLTAGTLALLIIAQLGGCARTNQAVHRSASLSGSQPIASGLKPATQVAPCCRALAEGRISLDQCMQNPQCIANNRTCCMNAIK